MRTTYGLVITMLSLVLGATGCSGAAGSPGAEQETWVLASFDGESAPVDSVDDVTSEFTLTDGKVTGNGGVNSFNGTYELSEKDIAFGPLASTRMAGPPKAMEQEMRFFKALEAAAHIEVRDEKLIVSDSDDTVLMRLTEALEG